MPEDERDLSALYDCPTIETVDRVVRELLAEAWDEGYQDGRFDGCHMGPEQANPYTTRLGGESDD